MDPDCCPECERHRTVIAAANVAHRAITDTDEIYKAASVHRALVVAADAADWAAFHANAAYHAAYRAHRATHGGDA